MTPRAPRCSVCGLPLRTWYFGEINPKHNCCRDWQISKDVHAIFDQAREHLGLPKKPFDLPIPRAKALEESCAF